VLKAKALRYYEYLMPSSVSISPSARRKGVLLVLGAGCAWGVISIFIRRLTTLGFLGWEISAMRCVLAGLIMAAVVPYVEPKAFRLRWRDAWCMAGCGIISMLLFNSCYFYTMQHTTVNIAVILLYSSPIFITLISRLCFKEAITKRKILALVIVTLGCILVSGALRQGGSISPFVFFMGLMSGLCYGLFSIFSRFAQQRGYSSLSITLWTFLISGGVSICLLDWGRFFSLMNSASVGSSWGILVGLVLIPTLLPYCLFTTGLKYIPPSLAGIVAAIEPVVATLVGFLCFGETLTWDAILGMLFVLGAIMI